MEKKHGYQLAPELVHEAIRASEEGNIYDFCDKHGIDTGVIIAHIEQNVPIQDTLLVAKICGALKSLPSDFSWGSITGNGAPEMRTITEKSIRRLGYERDSGKISSIQHAAAISKLLPFLTPKFKTESYLIAVDSRRIDKSYPSLNNPSDSLTQHKELGGSNATAPEDAEPASVTRRDEGTG